MYIAVLTLFPEMFTALKNTSIIKRAIQNNLITLSCINIRDFATDKHKSVDDTPYGGGGGMILRVDILYRALKQVKSTLQGDTYTILLDPAGIPYTQKNAQKLTTQTNIILICGHYEGIDDRIRTLVDCELSIGDYILTGGEIPAMVIIDSVTRLLPGALGYDTATKEESFSLPYAQSKKHITLLEYPQYTKPKTFQGMTVPDVLISGHHEHIKKWRQEQARKRTKKRRPDLLASSL